MGDLGLRAEAVEGVGTRLAKWKGQQGAPRPRSELLLTPLPGIMAESLGGRGLPRGAWTPPPLHPAMLVLPWCLERRPVMARGRVAIWTPHLPSSAPVG